MISHLHHSITSSINPCAAVWPPKCFRLHHTVWGRAWVGEGVRATELPGGSGAGVDHSGSGKVTYFGEKWHTKSTIVPLCRISQWTLCVSIIMRLYQLLSVLCPLWLVEKVVLWNRNVFISSKVQLNVFAEVQERPLCVCVVHQISSFNPVMQRHALIQNRFKKVDLSQLKSIFFPTLSHSPSVVRPQPSPGWSGATEDWIQRDHHSPQTNTIQEFHQGVLPGNTENCSLKFHPSYIFTYTQLGFSCRRRFVN